VIVDEAHSSQTGETARELKAFWAPARKMRRREGETPTGKIASTRSWPRAASSRT
jgi:hypothetical protein